MTAPTKKPRHELYEAIRQAYTTCAAPSLAYLPSDDVKLIEKFCWLVGCADILLPEYRLKWPHAVWWEDADFTTYLKKFAEDRGFNTDRRWDCAQLLRLVQAVPGDMAECGTYQGASAYLLAAACKAQNRHLHIFDSFEGLSNPDARDGEHWKKKALSATEDLLHQNLTDFKGCYSTYKGWIPERFPAVAGKTFAFVHIDVDLYQPTLDSLAFFYPCMPAGAVCICDDYGSTLCPGAKQAVDAFLADKTEKMLSLSGGSGFFIKGIATSAE